MNSMALTFVLEVDEMDWETQGQRWQLKIVSRGLLGHVYVFRKIQATYLICIYAYYSIC